VSTRRLLEQLLRAVGSGELAELEELLAGDVVAYNDGGGKTRAARKPVVGRDKVIRFIGNLLRRFGTSTDVHVLEVNGEPAAKISLAARTRSCPSMCGTGGCASILTVLNPDKLAWVRGDGEAVPAGEAQGGLGVELLGRARGHQFRARRCSPPGAPR